LCHPARAGTRAAEKAQHTCEYASILKKIATQPLGLAWGFAATYSPSLSRCRDGNADLLMLYARQQANDVTPVY